MKQMVLEKADLESCVNQAQRERVLIVRAGRPIALIVGVMARLIPFASGGGR